MSSKEIKKITNTLKQQLTYDRSVPLLTTSSRGISDTTGKASTIFLEHFSRPETILNNSYHAREKIPLNDSEMMKNRLYTSETSSLSNLADAMSKRIEHSTHLNLASPNSASHFRVSWYGLGALVESHSDVYGVEEEKKELHSNFKKYYDTGDNLATILIWLNDVQHGGGTFFISPSKRQLIKPLKGSMLLWVNIEASGRKSDFQEHGGCPVIKGSKFILGRWIYQYNQWKNIPCSIRKNAEIALTILPIGINS